MAHARRLGDASDSRFMKRLIALCLLASPALVVTGCPMYDDGGCRSDFDCGPGYVCHFSSGACARSRSGGAGASAAGEGGSDTSHAGEGGSPAGRGGEGGGASGAAGELQGGAASETAAGAGG
jgi:hypothetical protein